MSLTQAIDDLLAFVEAHCWADYYDREVHSQFHALDGTVYVEARRLELQAVLPRPDKSFRGSDAFVFVGRTNCPVLPRPLADTPSMGAVLQGTAGWVMDMLLLRRLAEERERGESPSKLALDLAPRQQKPNRDRTKGHRAKGRVGKPPLEKSNPVKLQVYERIKNEHQSGKPYADAIQRLQRDKDFMEQIRKAGLQLKSALVRAALAYFAQRKPPGAQETRN